MERELLEESAPVLGRLAPIPRRPAIEATDRLRLLVSLTNVSVVNDIDETSMRRVAGHRVRDIAGKSIIRALDHYPRAARGSRCIRPRAAAYV